MRPLKQLSVSFSKKLPSPVAHKVRAPTLGRCAHLVTPQPHLQTSLMHFWLSLECQQETSLAHHLQVYSRHPQVKATYLHYSNIPRRLSNDHHRWLLVSKAVETYRDKATQLN
uniref:Uncharacterized protein n=1 Tax=Timema monikensis TaxID=170555 RepID=A0A7R9HMJ2_9NEOP|nr:unnamed protein product [Timema monikensis]